MATPLSMFTNSPAVNNTLALKRRAKTCGYTIQRITPATNPTLTVKWDIEITPNNDNTPKLARTEDGYWQIQTAPHTNVRASQAVLIAEGLKQAAKMAHKLYDAQRLELVEYEA